MSSNGSEDSMSAKSNPVTPNTIATSLASTPEKDVTPAAKSEYADDSNGSKKTADDPEPTLDNSPGPESEQSPPDNRNDDLNLADPEGSTKDRSRHAPPPKKEDEGELSDGSSVFWESWPSRSRMSRIGDKKLIEKSKRRLEQHIHYTKLEAERLNRLESRLDILEKREPESDSESEEDVPQRKPAKPALNPVEWTEFKKLQNRGDSHYAIDVLVGEPVLFHQYQKNVAIAVASEQSQTPKVNMEEQTKDFPERIRINSLPLLKILRNVAGNEFKDVLDRPMVVLRPYKPLLYHLKDLQDTLNNLNNRWGVGIESIDHEKPTESARLASSDTEPTDAADAQPAEPSGEMTTSVAELHESAEARDDLQCLVRFLQDRLEHLNDRLKEKKPKVRFHDLWHIFKPGTLVFIKKTPDMVWKVLQATGGRNFLSAPGYGATTGPNFIQGSAFRLDCHYIDYDGQNFGPVQNKFEIKDFEGARDISSLGIYPVQYAESCADRLKDLTVRGEMFVKASKVQHMYCKGRTLTRTPSGARIEDVRHSEDLDSPVIIDFDRALQFKPDWKPAHGWSDPYEQSPFETTEMTLKAYVKCSQRDNCNTEYCCMNDNIVNDYSWDSQRMSEYVEEREKSVREKLQTEVQGPSDRIPIDEWKLLPNRVFGFILRSRKWGSMRLVPDLTPVKKDIGGLKLLELPAGHENIINSLVQIHFANRDLEKSNPAKEQFNFDPVRAKGKGLILLLHGAPGVGKTSTAECVAAANGKPLFPITCGDLGMTPIEVDRNLEMNFQLAQSWDCVLLLDEADVFLAERAKADVERNALVSVFLRALEYYTGVLFLTTNRVGTLDEAFKSRIHMSLLYPALSWQQTEAIWKKHLDRLENERSDITIERGDIMAFANIEFEKQVKAHKYGWNGRQIRNAFQTAAALAEHDAIRLASDAKHPPKTHLRRQFFEQVADAAIQFDDYLKKVYRESLTEHVNRKQWRNDVYQGPYEGAKGAIGHQQSGSNWAGNSTSQYGASSMPAPQWPAANPAPHQNNVPDYGGPNLHNSTQPVPGPYNQGYANNFHPSHGYLQPNNALPPNYGFGVPASQQQNYATIGGMHPAPGQPGGGGPYQQPNPGQPSINVPQPVGKQYGQSDGANPQQGATSYVQPGGVLPSQPNALYGQPGAGNPQQANNQYGQPGTGNAQQPNNQYGQPGPGNPQPPSNQYGQPGGGNP